MDQTRSVAGEELLEPRAGDLAEALRAFGYDLPTALADLVDNSIAARARTVRIGYSSDPGSAWLAVVDDGRGMDPAELREAMRFARDPGSQRSAGDLGRFGLGLKTASLSQARKLTVLSRGPGGSLTGMTWDLDHVRQSRQWLVVSGTDQEALEIADALDFTHQGTVVLWRHTDRLGDGPELRRRATDAGRELSLLFHRLMADGRLSLHVGRRLLSPMDPYLRRNPLTQDRGFEDLEHDGHRIRVNPVVLPHPSRLSREESLLASGPGGLLGRQGFYVYRGDRLVVAGGWLGLRRHAQHCIHAAGQDRGGDPLGRRPGLEGRRSQVRGPSSRADRGQAGRTGRGCPGPLRARVHPPRHPLARRGFTKRRQAGLAAGAQTRPVRIHHQPRAPLDRRSTIWPSGSRHRGDSPADREPPSPPTSPPTKPGRPPWTAAPPSLPMKPGRS